MNHLKARLFGLGLIIVGSGLTYYNWQQLWAEHEYSLKLAAFAPLCVVGGLFLLIFPTMAGKPNTAKEKVIVFVVFENWVGGGID